MRTTAGRLSKLVQSSSENDTERAAFIEQVSADVDKEAARLLRRSLYSGEMDILREAIETVLADHFRDIRSGQPPTFSI